MFRFVRFPQKSGADLGIVELKSSGWLAGYIEESGEVCRLCFFFFCLFVCLFVSASPLTLFQRLPCSPQTGTNTESPFFFFSLYTKRGQKKKRKKQATKPLRRTLRPGASSWATYVSNSTFFSIASFCPSFLFPFFFFWGGALSPSKRKGSKHLLSFVRNSTFKKKKKNSCLAPRRQKRHTYMYRCTL